MNDHMTVLDIALLDLYALYPHIEITCKSFAVLFSLAVFIIIYRSRHGPR